MLLRVYSLYFSYGLYKITVLAKKHNRIA